MTNATEISLFGEEFNYQAPKTYKRFNLKSETELLMYLKQFINVEEESLTPYKHKLGYYKKKGHYINGKKVNYQVYTYIKTWLERNI